MKRIISYTIFTATLMLALCYMTGSQVSAADPQSGSSRREKDSIKDPIEEKMEYERLKSLNQERYKAIKKDTDQLLALANELKQNVDKANENTLSLEVIKKTEEIEKLAKKVREKMKESYKSQSPFGM